MPGSRHFFQMAKQQLNILKKEPLQHGYIDFVPFFGHLGHIPGLIAVSYNDLDVANDWFGSDGKFPQNNDFRN